MADETIVAPTAPNIVKNSATERLREIMPKQDAPPPQPEIKNEEAKTEAKTDAPKQEVKKEEPKIEPKAEPKAAPEEKKELTPTAETELQKFLKEHNISSLAELEEKIAPKRIKTPDEEEAELIEYGVKEANLKIDDFIAVKNLEKAKDADIVFEDYSKRAQARNKNVTAEEIQEGFNKKYGNVVTDLEGNEKVVLDNDELAEVAGRIREERIAPIKAVKGKYQSHIQQQQFNQQIDREFKDISRSIADKVNIKIDDKNSLEYDLEPKYKQQLTETLKDQYALFRKQLGSNEKFDFEAYKKWFTESHVPEVVKQHNFGNILNIYAGKKVTEKELEYGKTLENPIIDSPNLNGGAKPTVDMQAEAAKLRQQLKSLK